LKEAAARYREYNFRGAHDLFGRLRESANPQFASLAALHQGMLLIEAGATGAAVNCLTTFLARASRSETDPERAILWTGLAWAHLRGGDHGAATLAASEAIRLQSGYVILANAGTIFARGGAVAQARKASGLCEEFAEMPAYRAASLKIQGEIARWEGRREQGLKLLRQASALEPRLAYREYLIEALDPADPERLDLCRHVVECPWLFARDPTINSPGVLALAVRTLLDAGIRDRQASELNQSLRDFSYAVKTLHYN
jgi:tetratricopeptide (TPR) repeat protein